MSSDPIDDDAVVRAHFDGTRAALATVDVGAMARAAGLLREARRRAATVYVIGNGGSASTASHFATDLSKATHRDSEPAVRALSLTDNSAFMTALSNDRGYEHVFADQLAGLLREGDVVIAISASGDSPSVLRAIDLARSRGAATVGLVGFDGGKLLRAVDVAIHVRSERGAYGIVEDAHLAIHHALTACLSRA